MKVLYLVKNHFVLSESYIFSEQKFMFANSVDVGSYSPKDPIPFLEKVRLWKPDLVHVHWITIANEYAADLAKLKVPVTVRGHSFDSTASEIEACLRIPTVKKLWLFPHIARQYASPRIESLNACYDIPGFSNDTVIKNLVMRAGAGLPGKGWEEMIDLAEELPECNFVFVMTHPKADPTWPDKHIAPHLPKNVMLKMDIPHDQVCVMTAQAGIYVRGDGKAHEWAMPVSALEAMASGCLTFVPLLPHAREYLGDGAYFYESMDELVAQIKFALALPDDEVARCKDAAVKAVSQYSFGKVLPKVLSEWRSLIRENEKAPLG